MPITIFEKERRKNYIGSSDVAALVGMDKFKTSFDVFLEKTGKVVKEDIGEPAKAGTVFEEALLNYTEEQLGKIKRNQRRAIEGTMIRTSIDAIVVESGQPVEAKTAGLYGPLTEDWGDTGTDQVPDRVICQAQIHMKALEQELCWVSTFLGGRGFGMYQVPRNEQLIAVLLEAAQDFWMKHVIPDIPPTGSIPSLNLIRRVIRTPNKIVVFGPEQFTTFDNWQAAKALAGDAEKYADTLKAQVLSYLGDAECADMGESGALTYLESNRKGYEVKATTVRTLRVLPKGLPEPLKKMLLEQEKSSNNSENTLDK